MAESRFNPSETNDSPSFSPSIKIAPSDSTEMPSLKPTISSTRSDGSNTPSTTKEDISSSSIPTSILSISSSMKTTPLGSIDQDKESYMPSFAPTVILGNNTFPTPKPTRKKNHSRNPTTYSTSSTIPPTPEPTPKWKNHPKPPTTDNFPTTTRPTAMLEFPTQPPHIQYEYEVNSRIALVVIAVPMLLFSGCFLWRWYHHKKFERSYRDFETSAFSAYDHEFA